tara:strand:- start:172 stop:546 length:375 start_codon:yes stop_codon:yes gene_type:complete
MKKLILLLTFLLTTLVSAEESDIKKYNFYWSQVPVVCAAPEEIDRWSNDNNFTPLTLSYGRKDGDPEGEVVYIVTYYINKQNGESFATVTAPNDPDVCIIFRTFDMVLNPKIMDEYLQKRGLDL